MHASPNLNKLIYFDGSSYVVHGGIMKISVVVALLLFLCHTAFAGLSCVTPVNGLRFLQRMILNSCR